MPRPTCRWSTASSWTWPTAPRRRRHSARRCLSSWPVDSSWRWSLRRPTPRPRRAPVEPCSASVLRDAAAGWARAPSPRSSCCARTRSPSTRPRAQSTWARIGGGGGTSTSRARSTGAPRRGCCQAWRRCACWPCRASRPTRPPAAQRPTSSGAGGASSTGCGSHRRGLRPSAPSWAPRAGRGASCPPVRSGLSRARLARTAPRGCRCSRRSSGSAPSSRRSSCSAAAASASAWPTPRRCRRHRLLSRAASSSLHPA